MSDDPERQVLEREFRKAAPRCGIRWQYASDVAVRVWASKLYLLSLEMSYDPISITETLRNEKLGMPADLQTDASLAQLC